VADASLRHARRLSIVAGTHAALVGYPGYAVRTVPACVSDCRVMINCRQSLGSDQDDRAASNDTRSCASYGDRKDRRLEPSGRILPVRIYGGNVVTSVGTVRLGGSRLTQSVIQSFLKLLVAWPLFVRPR